MLQKLPLVLWCLFMTLKARLVDSKIKNMATIQLLHCPQKLISVLIFATKKKRPVIFTFSQCSQQKFLIHNAWIPLKKRKKEKKRKRKKKMGHV